VIETPGWIFCYSILLCDRHDLVTELVCSCGAVHNPGALIRSRGLLEHDAATGLVDRTLTWECKVNATVYIERSGDTLGGECGQLAPPHALRCTRGLER
jgi:hypothetical protein